MSVAALAEHFFRHEYGRVVSILCNRVGLQHVERVEDAVQDALIKALEQWTASGLPNNPSGWVYRVAYNRLLAELRQQSSRGNLIDQVDLNDIHHLDDASLPVMSGDVEDELLRMLLVCCDDSISEQSQLVMALKVLCGFSIREIALRLFISQDTAYKCLSRARKQLKQLPANFVSLTPADHAHNIPSVQKILYLMFTEGYQSVHTDSSTRQELCDEAIRLTTLLVQNPLGDSPRTSALLALMHLHRSRMNGRENDCGGLLLLEEQDRSLWNQQQIELGMTWLARSAQGEDFSRYHAEAGVAAEHCLAPSYQQTRWDRVADCYSLLERHVHSPIHALNRAVAIAEWKGAEAGLEVLESIEAPSWLLDSYQWAAVAADLHARCGHLVLAEEYKESAATRAPTDALRVLLLRRLNAGVERAGVSDLNSGSVC